MKYNYKKQIDTAKRPQVVSQEWVQMEESYSETLRSI